MRSIHRLSTVSTALSTDKKDNFPYLTSTFTTFPQKRATPITTTFIYKYLSPQANLWLSNLKLELSSHSASEPNYAKLSNLGGSTRYQTIDMRASA